MLVSLSWLVAGRERNLLERLSCNVLGFKLWKKDCWHFCAELRYLTLYVHSFWCAPLQLQLFQLPRKNMLGLVWACLLYYCHGFLCAKHGGNKCAEQVIPSPRAPLVFGIHWSKWWSSSVSGCLEAPTAWSDNKDIQTNIFEHHLNWLNWLNLQTGCFSAQPCWAFVCYGICRILVDWIRPTGFPAIDHVCLQLHLSEILTGPERAVNSNISSIFQYLPESFIGFHGSWLQQTCDESGAVSLQG